MARCYFCKEKVDAEDTLCYGCDEYICDDCSTRDPWGDHDPEDHSE